MHVMRVFKIHNDKGSWCALNGLSQIMLIVAYHTKSNATLKRVTSHLSSLGNTIQVVLENPLSKLYIMFFLKLLYTFLLWMWTMRTTGYHLLYPSIIAPQSNQYSSFRYAGRVHHFHNNTIIKILNVDSIWLKKCCLAMFAKQRQWYNKFFSWTSKKMFFYHRRKVVCTYPNWK